MVASVAMPGRNPDGSYGARPDSTVPHAISEPAALTAEQEEEMAAMAKWAKAEEGMRLVQELESHSAQRDDAIANLQNMLNGIGKTTDVAEAAALAAAPPAPPVPPTGAPAVNNVDVAANNIVPDMMPTPSPVAAVPVAPPPAPPPVAPPPLATAPEQHASATPPPSEGDAGALAALARGELPASFPPPTPAKKFVMRKFGDGDAPGPSDPVAPAAAVSSPTSATDVDGVSSPTSEVVFYECSAWPKGEASEWPRVKGDTSSLDVYPAQGAEDDAAVIDSLAAMKVAEAEAAIHAGTTRGIPVVPVVDDPRTLERSDPFAAFLSHVDKVLERSENAGSFDEDDETNEIVVAPVDPIEEEARAFAASIAPPPPAQGAVESAPEKLEEPDVEPHQPVVEEDVHAELALARDRLEAAEAFAETLAHDMEQAYAEMAAAKQEAAAAKRLAESATSAPERTARVSELLDELERWQLAAATAEAALEEAKMELEVMTARAAEEELSTDDDVNDDVIAELAAELQAAEAKAAKAEADADELDAHLRRLEEELADAKNEAKAELERTKNDAKAELERAEAAVTELERELETANAKVLETAVESEALAALTAELDEARAVAERAETEMDALKRATTAELDAARAEIADARAEIDAERAAKSALEKGLEEALADAEEEKARALSSAADELEAAKAQKASAELEKDGELATLRAGLEEARAFVAEKAAEIAALKEEAAFNAQKMATDDSALAAAKEAEKAAETIQAAAEQLREAKANAADLAAQMEAKDEEITALRLECEDVKAQAMNAARDGRARIDALEARAAALDACRETVEEVKMHAAAAALCAAVAMLPRMREAGIIHA